METIDVQRVVRVGWAPYGRLVWLGKAGAPEGPLVELATAIAAGRSAKPVFIRLEPSSVAAAYGLAKIDLSVVPEVWYPHVGRTPMSDPVIVCPIECFAMPISATAERAARTESTDFRVGYLDASSLAPRLVLLGAEAPMDLRAMLSSTDVTQALADAKIDVACVDVASIADTHALARAPDQLADLADATEELRFQLPDADEEYRQYINGCIRYFVRSGELARWLGDDQAWTPTVSK